MSNHRFFLRPILLSLGITATHAQAEQPVPAQRQYNEPTRGFFLEHGELARNGKASVELQSSAGDSPDLGGGIRLGLAKAEVLINSGLNDYDQNEVMVKFGLPRFARDEGSTTAINWAFLGGLAHFDTEDDANNEFKQTNLKLGMTATIRADAGIFTVQPMLVYANGKAGNNKIDDTFLELGLGAYLGLIDTDAGKFSIGVEALITTQDHVFDFNTNNTNRRDKDNTFALGAKWAYNEKVHIDFVPFVRANDEWLGIPGVVRLNVAF
jgi:hypothetical protein